MKILSRGLLIDPFQMLEDKNCVVQAVNWSGGVPLAQVWDPGSKKTCSLPATNTISELDCGFFKHNYLSNNFRLVSIPRPGFELESLCPEELNDWAYLVSKGLALDWEFFHWFVITIWSKFHIRSSNIMDRAYYSHHSRRCSFSPKWVQLNWINWTWLYYILGGIVEYWSA